MKKDILSELKGFDINAINMHEEKEYNNYIISTLLIKYTTTTLNSTTDSFDVSLLIYNKNDKKVYKDILFKTFELEKDATNYYNELRLKVLDTNEDEIRNLLLLK